MLSNRSPSFSVAVLLGCSLLSCGCNSAKQSAELERIRAELKQQRIDAETLKSKLTLQSHASRNATELSRLVHIVLLDLKDDLDKNRLQEIRESIFDLNKIEQVNDLRVGHFHDLDDDRALARYDLIFQMRFGSDQDYLEYQGHGVHVELKNYIKPFLESAPVTYDYMEQDR